MLLVVEQGNTNTVFAGWADDGWSAEFRVVTRAERTADDYAEWLGPMLASVSSGFGEIDGCIVSSVVPAGVPALREFAERRLGLPALVVGEDVRPRLEIRLAEPQAVGADRLINAVGGFRAYGGPLLIVDSGTALKFDVVARDGAFEGGAIAPGVACSSEALFRKAARLGATAITKPDAAIGRNIEAALRSGLYWGFVAMIEGMIARMREAYPEPLTVIATGGVSGLFAGEIAGVDHYDSRLTLTGLVEVWRDRIEGRA